MIQDQLNVLILTNSLDPKNGGSVTCVLNVIDAYEKHSSFDITVAYIDDNDSTTNSHGTDQGTQRVTKLPFKSTFSTNLSRNWAISIKLTWWLAKNLKRFDAVELHGSWHIPTLAGTLLSSLYRVPNILFPHETLTTFDIYTSQKRILTRLKTLILSLYRRTVSHTVYSSNLERDRSIHVSRNTVVAHAVVDTCPNTPPPIADQARVGFLSRLHPKKRLDLAILGVAQLLPTPPELIVAGEGPELEEAKRLAERAGVSDYVHFLGFIPRHELEDFFRHISVLLMPSDFECFGMSAAEALANGRPVILTPQVGIAQFVANTNAGLVSQPDPASIATALKNVLETNSFLPRGVAAIQVAKTHFTFEAYAASLTTLHHYLASSKKSNNRAALRPSL